jgi:hypothetical protein
VLFQPDDTDIASNVMSRNGNAECGANRDASRPLIPLNSQSLYVSTFQRFVSVEATHLVPSLRRNSAPAPAHLVDP